MVYEFDLSGDLSRFHASYINRLAQLGQVDLDLVIIDKQEVISFSRIHKSLLAAQETQEIIEDLATVEAQQMLDAYNASQEVI